MQNTYNEEQVYAWLEQATKDLTANKIVSVYANALRTLSKRALRSLNRLTLMSILNRVLYQCKERYPLLQDLSLDSLGINLDQCLHQLEHAKPEDLKEAFQYLFVELFSVLGDLTADLVSSGIENGKESQVEEAIVDLNEYSYERLESLYEISKLFAGFESVIKTFPEILLSLSSLFSFKTITLIESKPNSTSTMVWHDPYADKQCVDRAVGHARKLYEYLVCPISQECIIDQTVQTFSLPVCSLEAAMDSHSGRSNRYITLPLCLSSLETFGILQFENFGPMTEADLRYINALNNLIAVTLDRFNKEVEAEDIRQRELSKQARALSDAQEYAVSLEKERELREQFVAALTHDLRTPLTAAKMGAQFILRKPENVEKNQQLAVKIIRSIDRMDQMIRDLLDASRIRAGESLSLIMNECDLKEVALTSLRELSAAYGDRFMLDTDRDVITGYWNEEGLRRVIENLANNAVKYGDPQGLITVTLRQNTKTAQISVHNFGNPIPKEDHARFFEPFQRAKSTQTAKKGWGLGLTLVKGVVEAHGGSVTVSSNEEEGTSFTVTLPKDSRPFQILH